MKHLSQVTISGAEDVENLQPAGEITIPANFNNFSEEQLKVFFRENWGKKVHHTDETAIAEK